MKLEKIVAELQLKDTVTLVDVDVSSRPSLDAAIKRARIVINTVGPYWTWGTSVVETCVLHQKHYVDISGESSLLLLLHFLIWRVGEAVWIQAIIAQ